MRERSSHARSCPQPTARLKHAAQLGSPCRARAHRRVSDARGHAGYPVDDPGLKHRIEAGLVTTCSGVRGVGAARYVPHRSSWPAEDQPRSDSVAGALLPVSDGGRHDGPRPLFGLRMDYHVLILSVRVRQSFDAAVLLLRWGSPEPDEQFSPMRCVGSACHGRSRASLDRRWAPDQESTHEGHDPGQATAQPTSSSSTTSSCRSSRTTRCSYAFTRPALVPMCGIS